MRDTVYKEEQITRLANDLSLPVIKVVDIWDAYVDNLLYHICDRKVHFLYPLQ